MGSKSKRKPRVKSRKKPVPETPASASPPSLKVVEPEDRSKPEQEPAPTVRPLNPTQALQYKFALLQEEIIGEKKKIVALKRVVIRKDEEILALRRETADLKETLVAREERDLHRDNQVLLQRLGVGESEEVLIDGGRLFIAPVGTAGKRKGNG